MELTCFEPLKVWRGSLGSLADELTFLIVRSVSSCQNPYHLVRNYDPAVGFDSPRPVPGLRATPHIMYDVP
jgi:hypothetical protein